MSELSSVEIIEAIRENKFEFNLKCIKDLPPYIKSFSTGAFNKCKKVLIEKDSKPCLKHLTFYKAYVMFNDIKDRPLASMYDEELIQGFFATWDNPDKLSRIIQELSIRMPDSFIVAKASLLPLLLKAKSKEQFAKAINLKIKKALQLNPKDRDLKSLEMFADMVNKKPNFKDQLREYSKKNLDSGIGLYYESILSWRKKDKAMTVKFLKDALKREPNNTKYIHTLEKVKTGNYGDKVFSIKLIFYPEEF